MSEALKYENDDPVMFGPKQLVSSTKLVRNLSSYLDMAQKSPVFVEREQEVEAVLISIDDYRQLLREEERVEELYHAVVALRRLVEHQKLGQQALSTDEVMKKLGISKEALAEVAADVAD